MRFTYRNCIGAVIYPHITIKGIDSMKMLVIIALAIFIIGYVALMVQYF